MSRHRFFLSDPFTAARAGAVVVAPLSSEDARHAVRALRLRIAEEIDLVEPSGVVWRTAVSAIEGDVVRVELVETLATAREPDVTLLFGVLKGGKNDDVIEGAVEVGVSAIRPVLFERSIVRLDAAKRSERGERWRRIALAAAKQSKRTHVPAVADPVELADALAKLPAFDAVLVAWEDAADAGIASRLAELGLRANARVAVVVGPEGGLSADEVSSLVAAGAVTCTLGPTILRAQTAAVVATTLVVHELGGLGNGR